MNRPSLTEPSGEPAALLAYLRTRGVLDPAIDPSEATITHLTGGVSGQATLVEAGSQRIVVKRALHKLLVAADWYAKPERAITEAAAIDVLHAITPAQTPALLDVDPLRFTLAMSAANAGWVPWKGRLLHDPLLPELEMTVGATLGTVLGTWHRATAADEQLAERFDDREAFEQLRIGPFHRVIAARHPEVAAAIQTCIADLQTRRDCLVHGDYSPKNVLVAPADTLGLSARDGLMVLDYEVACYGASVFDSAFLLCHLMMKAVHRPGQRHLFHQISGAFLNAYATEFGAVPGPRLGWHTACLLLARVDGTSPSGYLTEGGEALVRQLALNVLSADPPTVSDLWQRAFTLITQSGASA